MMKKLLWIVMIFFAIVIGCYPAIYFFIDKKFGLLSTKESVVLGSIIWTSAFYIHIVLGGIALLIGWTQFSIKLRERYLKIHRNIGRIYVSSAVLSALTGLYIAFYATGGIIAKTGFIGLGIAWLGITIQAYRVIRKKEIKRHQMLMVYSYAACLAAVTLRIWLPLLVIAFHSFIPAYRIVSWLCWVPNLIVAFIITRKMNAVHESIPQR